MEAHLFSNCHMLRPIFLLFPACLLVSEQVDPVRAAGQREGLSLPFHLLVLYRHITCTQVKGGNRQAEGHNGRMLEEEGMDALCCGATVWPHQLVCAYGDTDR